jgi:N-acyl-D-aspartate/D-glutamate deacylase
MFIQSVEILALLAVLLATAIAATLAGPSRPLAAAVEVDVLLAGGEVYDATGAKARRADVGIRGDRIVFVGDAAKAGVKATRTIDVSGLVVAPGFIDTHTHAGDDLASPEKKGNVNFLMQGVTTVVVGNDGGGTFNVAATLKKWEEQGIGTNGMQLVGFGAVRTQVLGRGDVQPTPEQLTEMRGLVRKGMEEGAFGFSTGLFYTPQNYSKTEEVIELAKVAGEMGGVYDSHLRDEDSYSIGVLGAIEEAIRIGREAKIPVNISHLKCLGPLVWGQSARAIEIIQKARKAGVSVTADQYPYTASGSNLVSSLLPSWAQAGRREEVLARLKDPAQRAKIAAEMEENLKRRAGPDAILFRAKGSPLMGKTLAQVSKERGKPPVETAIELITENYEGQLAGSLAIVSFNMNDADVERFMKQDFVMTGSDGSAGHPRMYGTYPRKLRIYVREKKTISLARFVQASSAQPAAAFRVPERGQIREGWFADVVVFDAKTITDKATYTEPEILSEGMKFVFVNGKLAVENGAYTGALAGRALRKTR